MIGALLSRNGEHLDWNNTVLGEVEILADEAWRVRRNPKEDVTLIREKADFDIDRILEIEQQTRHDVVAFTCGFYERFWWRKWDTMGWLLLTW